ncbi:lantibiotic dehydratase [Allokutzneria multivorans]
MGSSPLYRHRGVALLRCAAVPTTTGPRSWPDPDDPASCRAWLDEVWSDAFYAEAITVASPSLATRVHAIRSGAAVSAKRLRRAALATLGYVVRSVARPTPFGTFAGVAPVTIGNDAHVQWRGEHRVLGRADTQWLSEIVETAEQCPELLERLEVVSCDLAVRRGSRRELPRGQNRVSILNTTAVETALDLAAAPIHFGTLMTEVARSFPEADASRVRSLLTELVSKGYLITNLHAPHTVTDPLAYITAALRAAGADTLDEPAVLLAELERVQADILCHNSTTARSTRTETRTKLTARMNRIAARARMPLAHDLLLDCHVQIPPIVVEEMERAASALLRLTRHPSGQQVWREYHVAFCDRYGTGTLVALADVVHPDSGLGYPAGYPGSVMSAPAAHASERDERLLGLALQAVVDGTGEVVLTDELIAELADERFDTRFIPPHVELAARIHATDLDQLKRGDFTLTAAPARSAGTLTSRFTPLATGDGFGLPGLYKALPASTEKALRVQLSYGPLYPHAENVSRTPAYLERVLSLGEHRCEDDAVLRLADLAVTATHERLYVISRTRRQVIEPNIFHALAIDKQPPPIARFLTELPRAFSAGWFQFDWGPHARLPYLPRVRYGRTVLSTAQWRLISSDLPAEPHHDDVRWWRERWRCPVEVELREADRGLRLNLDVPAHVAILCAHLARHGHAVLTEAAPVRDYGWLDGRVHEVAVPLACTTSPAPSPLRQPTTFVSNTCGEIPGARGTRWLSAKVFTHPERIDDVIATHLPKLEAALGTTNLWWLRYRTPPAETDHLRVRLPAELDTEPMRVLGDWAHELRNQGLISRLSLDTYYPETGRYGDGPVLAAAEDVFVADSRLVAAALRQPLATAVSPVAWTVVNMIALAHGLLGGDRAETMNWLATQPVITGPAADRKVAAETILLSTNDNELQECPLWTDDVEVLWRERHAALTAYREQLPEATVVGDVLESLLHMHHNRALGIDRDREQLCRRLARQAALSWRARGGGGTP